MTPYYEDESVTLHHGDCLDVMATLPDASVDAVVTDPPYGLEFMGKGWDAPWQTGDDVNADAGFGEFGLADKFKRLPLPSFTGSTNPKCLDCGGTRRGRRDGTAKRQVCVCAEPRFPNVRAAEMRAFGEWCEQWATECLRVLKPGGHLLAFGGSRTWHRLAAAIEDAGFELRDSIAWLYGSGFPKSLNLDGDRKGWGTALKPAFEPIVVARKPLAGTVAANVLAHGTGALNIDGCRVEGIADRPGTTPPSDGRRGSMSGDLPRLDYEPNAAGRWPTNVVLDGDQADELDRQSGVLTSGKMMPTHTTAGVNGRSVYGADAASGFTTMETYGDAGGASRFFPVFRYEAKAPTAERPRDGEVAHPTVKPLDLMRWLVRLVTPPGGTVLEPFAGSGTTAEACVIEGFRCIAIEREAAYLPLIVARLSKPIQPDLFGGAA